MDEKLTTGRLLRAWWAMQWRAVVATFLGSLVLVALFSFVAALLGVSKELIMAVGNVIYVGVSLFASIYFFGFALKKDYGDFRFEVVERETEERRNEKGPLQEQSREPSPERAGSAPDLESITNMKERE
ncbi:hypothetical protein [Hydrogenimonas sp.]